MNPSHDPAAVTFESFLAPPKPAARRKASVPMRVMAGLVGGVLLLLATLLTLGIGLVPVLGIGVAMGIGSLRGRRTGMLGSWIGAAGATSALMLSLLAWSMQKSPTSLVDEMQKAVNQSYQTRRADGRAHPAPGTAGDPFRGDTATAAKTRRVVASRPFAWWMAAMAFVMGSGITGMIAATPVWGALMLFLFGVRGRLPFSPEPDAG